MKFRNSLILICLFFTTGIHAEEDKYKICFINGYFSGEDDKFMIGLATYIASKEKVLTEPMCAAAHQIAYKVGVKFSTTGKYDTTEQEKIIRYASDFREKVNKAISELIKK